jgi:hypothetical protein
MCPRFGDAYARTERADIVKDEVAFYRIKKAVDKKLDCIDLAGCRYVHMQRGRSQNNVEMISDELKLAR